MFKKQGFTLVEILLVVVIVGILAAIVIPRITYSKKEAQIAACDANVAALNSQLELWHMQKGTTTVPYPADLATLVSDDYIDAVPICPFNVAYSYTNTTGRVAKHTTH